MMMFVVRREWWWMPCGHEPFVIVVVKVIRWLAASRMPRVEMRSGQIFLFGFRLELAQGPRIVCHRIRLRSSRPVGVARVACRLRCPGRRAAKTLHLADNVAKAFGAIPAR